jgi:hypothetical protein
MDTLEQTIKVYPTPNQGDLIIEMSAMQNAYVYIFDLYGKLVHDQVLNSATEHINIHNLDAGVYMVSVTTEQGVQTFKITKE